MYESEHKTDDEAGDVTFVLVARNTKDSVDEDESKDNFNKEGTSGAESTELVLAKTSYSLITTS